MKRQRFRPRKTRELILYVCRAFSGNPTFDIGMLFNVMFQIDMEAFRTSGQTITGARWHKTKDGFAL